MLDGKTLQVSSNRIGLVALDPDLSSGSVVGIIEYWVTQVRKGAQRTS